MRVLAVIALIAFAPAVSLAQSAGEVERCFQNPGACAKAEEAEEEPLPKRPPAAGWRWRRTGDDPAGGAGP